MHVFLNKADIFKKLVNANVPKPLRNVCTEFDVDTFGGMTSLEVLDIATPR